MERTSVIIVSAQHCGCSFLGALIAEAHRRTYGKPIYFNYEISRMQAVDPRYICPVGYNRDIIACIT